MGTAGMAGCRDFLITGHVFPIGESRKLPVQKVFDIRQSETAWQCRESSIPH